MEIIKGNIFTTQCQTIVNPVNCVGVMGAGLAFECRLRYPEMFEKYVEICKEGKLKVGLLWLFQSDNKWILNLPTKNDWKYPSKEEYLIKGLEKFVMTYKERGITSIAFPLLGADRGGLPSDVVLDIMKSYLSDLPIEIEIYLYDPTAEDDLYLQTKQWLLSKSIDELKKSTGLRVNYIEKVISAIQSNKVVQLNQLAGVKGIGIKTLEAVFKASKETNSKDSTEEAQQSLLGI
jgi:O-acetyl-ADP-ribose deacetylase (regulator of RNase III)